MHVLAQWIAAFREENPLVQYDIYSATADEVKDRIEKGILGMGLLVEPVDVSKYEFIRIPCKERWGLLTQVNSPLAELECVTPDDLAHIPLLIAISALSHCGQHWREVPFWYGKSIRPTLLPPPDSLPTFRNTLSV